MIRFLHFIQSKIRNKVWLMAALLIGNILLTAICASCPLYLDAAGQKSLVAAMNDYVDQTGKNAGSIEWKASYGATQTVAQQQEILAYGDSLLADFSDQAGIPLTASVRTRTLTNFPLTKGGTTTRIGIMLTDKQDLSDHISVQDGHGFTDTTDYIEILVSDKTQLKLHLQVGDIFSATNPNDSEEQLTFKLVGVFVIGDTSDPYWDVSPSSLTNYFFISSENYEEYYATTRNTTSLTWRAVLDSNELRLDKLQKIQAMDSDLPNGFEMTTGFGSILSNALNDNFKLTITLWILQIITLLLLVVFLFMVSGQMIELEQNEISVYKSRGGSKRQIFSLYLLQSSLLALAGFVIGMPLAAFLCQTIGSANEFLGFVSRKALSLRFGWQVWVFGAAAMLLSVITMILPVARQSRLDIVQAKLKKQQKKKRPFWKLCCLDILLLAVSLYTWFLHNGKVTLLAEQLLSGDSVDPLVYVAAALFLIGASLLVLRIYPWILKLVFVIGKKFWSPSLYASFLQMIRSGGKQGFLMVFLMLTVASGVYYTGAACSINENAEQQLYYTSGADLVLQERWEATSTTVQNELGMDTNETYVGYIEPDISKYVALAEDTPEIVSMAKVYNETGDTAKCKLTTEVKNVQIMGIQTKEFGETCNMDSSLLPTHLNNYLNAMSVNPRSVLVSTNFHDVYGVEIGESISYTTSTGGKLTGIVTGFVDYFPTYSPTIQVNGESVDQFLVVASFSQLYSLYDQNNGIPYQIWYKLSGSSQFIYDFAEENGISYAVFSDYHANQISMKNEPLLQGTNGVLTIGFIVTLLLCAVGFLMYWILSIRARQLQFGIYRAMGMSTGGMMSMLLCEQICVSGVSILAGVAIGLIASKLYVPLIQMAYTASEQVLPLEVITSAADLWKLFAVIAVTMIICLTVITVMIRKLKISQALKLGED